MSSEAASPDTLWRHADFLRLWSAHTVSDFGARITREGLPLAAILTLDAKPAQLGVLAALAMAPGIVVGLFAGGFVDRSRRRSIMIVSDLIRAAVLLTVPLAAWLGILDIAHLYVAAALVGGANVLFEIAGHAYLPSLIGRGHLIEGNAKFGATESIAEVGGPAVAGLLFQILSAPFAILVNVATYLASALLLGAIRDREMPASFPVTGWRADLSAGFAVVLGHPLIRPIFLIAAVANIFFGAFFGALYNVFALRELLLTPAMLGVTIAAGGGGAFLGALFAPRLAERMGIGPAILVSLFLRGLCTLLIPLADGTPFTAMLFLIAAQFLGDGFQVAGDISSSSLRQSALPLDLMGRVGAAFQIGTGLMAVLGALAAGALADQFGARAVLWAAALGLVVAPLFGVFSPLRGLRVLPVAQD